jgi:FAD/FMN-containing dehydrogenase
MKPETLSKEDFLKQTHQVDADLFKLVQQFEGSISAEHGIGLLKKDFLHFTRTPSELELLKEIKVLFDPKNLLNPGKIF